MGKRWWLWLFLLVGCSASPAVETAVTVPGCQAGEAMEDAPAVPEGVLLQSVLVNAEGETSGYRIFADGRYQTKSISQDWADADALTTGQVERVQTIITDAPIEQLEAVYEPTRAGEDRNTLWMQVAKGGQLYQVAIVGSCEVPPIQTLTQQLFEVFR